MRAVFVSVCSWLGSLALACVFLARNLGFALRYVFRLAPRRERAPLVRVWCMGGPLNGFDHLIPDPKEHLMFFEDDLTAKRRKVLVYQRALGGLASHGMGFAVPYLFRGVEYV